MSKHKRKINKLLELLKNSKDTCSKEVRNTYLKELYDMTYNHLLIVAGAYLVDKSEREDVVNAAYMKALHYIKSCDTEKDGYNWLCKIVQNIAYDFNKQKKPVEAYTDEVRMKEEENVDEVFEESAEKGELYEAIKILPEIEQKMIYYRYWEDMTYDEIAEKLELKRTAVYDTIKRSIKKISEKIMKNPKNRNL